MKTFRFYWNNGEKAESKGRNAVEAFTRLGCGKNDLRTLIYFRQID